MPDNNGHITTDLEGALLHCHDMAMSNNPKTAFAGRLYKELHPVFDRIRNKEQEGGTPEDFYNFMIPSILTSILFSQLTPYPDKKKRKAMLKTAREEFISTFDKIEKDFMKIE